MSRNATAIMLLSATLCSIMGCSPAGPPVPKVVRVTGTVTLDGQPLVGAAVTFAHNASGASGLGVTDAQGHYSLISYLGPRKEAQGVIPQEYQVTISKFIPPNGMTQQEYQTKLDAANKLGATGAILTPDQQPPVLLQLLPPRYSAAGKSELNATVTDKGKNQFDFPLKSSSAP